MYLNLLSSVSLNKYYIRQFNINKSYIFIQISCNLIYGYNEDYNEDLYAAITAYDKLKSKYPEQDFFIAVGGVGSSQSKVHIKNGGILDLSLIGPATHYQHTKWEDLLSVMERHGVHAINMEYYYKGFDGLSNDALEEVHTGAHYSDNLVSLADFHRLKNLEIKYFDDKSVDSSNLTFLSQMNDLEKLTISGNMEKIIFPTIPCDNITEICIFDESGNDTMEMKKQLCKVFPNALISINIID